MKHVVTQPTAPFVSSDGSLEVHQIPSWEDNLIWLCVDPKTKEAAAVDGPEAETVLAYAEKHGFKLTTIFNTHTHADHVGINTDLEGRGLLADMRVVGCVETKSAIPGFTEGVDEGDRINFGQAEARVLRTEGHINGHVSYVFDDILFCGDTMFAGGCGYLFDGPPSKMQDSLARLGALDPKTRVCCAHEYTQDNLRFAWSVEPDNQALVERIQQAWKLRAEGGCTVPSTIELELATNPFLRWSSPSIQENVRKHMPDAPMNTPAEIFAATRELKNKGMYKELGDAPLPL